MPEAAPAAPAAPATPPPVSPADEQRALIARENGTTYDAGSQTFADAPADGATPATPASGEPAQNDDANSEAQGQDPTPVEGGGDEGEGSEQSAEGETQSQQPGKNRVARKIDTLTKENAQLKRAFAEMLQRMQTGQPAQPQQQPAQAPQQADPKPDPTKYTDVSQFISDTAAWRARQETRAALGQVFGQLAQQAAQQQAVQQAEQQVQEFNSRVSEGAKEIKDFAQVTAASADVEVAPHVASVLMQGVENPSLVLYHLAKNPAVVDQLNKMPPAKVAARLGAIEANAKRAPQISNAPKPGVPVAAKGSAAADYSDDMTEEQFMEKRNADLRAKARK